MDRIVNADEPEIKITSEMMEAGAELLADFDPRDAFSWETKCEFAAELYAVMAGARFRKTGSSG